MAETEQRFVLRWSYRNIARIIGYPAGLFLLMLALGAIEAGDLGAGILVAVCGLATLLWTWSASRRRIEVTEQTVTVVNSFRRHEVPWTALADIKLVPINYTFHRLGFAVAHKRIVAEAPIGSRDKLMKVRARILRAGGHPLADDPTPEVVWPVSAHGRRAFMNPSGGSGYVVAAIFGLISLAVGLDLWYDHFRAYEYGPPTTGVVEEVYDNETGLVTFFAEGEQWEIVDKIFGYEVGESVFVAYNPEDPSRYASVRPGLGGGSPQWWFLGIGVLILGPTAFFFVRGKRWRRVE